MIRHVKTISLLLVLCLAAGLTACGTGETSAPASGTNLNPVRPPSSATSIAPPPPASDTDIPETAPAPDADLRVNVMALNGSTGFGMAKLMSESEKGGALLNYSFQVDPDVSNVTAALISGSADIAALPTNAAAALYNKTGGGVQLLALNTLGVLYLLVNGDTENIRSVSDLAGKTVYVPAQNPTFIFRYICQSNGLDDVVIDNSYAQPADLRTAIAAGEVDIAVLPEPMVTIALSANDALVNALDLTAEWNAVAPVADSLVQGCVAVRTEFAAEHPAEVEAFLDEYAQSIAYLSSGADDIGDMIEAAGIFSNGAVAQKAVPGCNVCFISGADMVGQMETFLDIMLSLAPDSIGGGLPGEDFYYLGGQ